MFVYICIFIFDVGFNSCCCLILFLLYLLIIEFMLFKRLDVSNLIVVYIILNYYSKKYIRNFL